MNLHAYNTTGFNIPFFGAPAMPTSLLSFDGFDLADGVNLVISDIRFNSGHKREFDQFSVPRANGIRVASVYEREKIITASGVCRAASAEALETYIDTLKKNLRKHRRQLVTNWAGKSRLYEKATLQNMDALFPDRKHYHITYVPVTLEFLCEDFATDWNYEQWNDEFTAAEDTLATYGRGTQESKPVIICVFSAASGVTELTVKVDENGNTIRYEGAISAGDSIVFDCEQEKVLKNGIEVDFKGYFPKMEVGNATFRFTTNGASRTFRATVKTKPAYS
ncbi:MAG: phage tail family protein [Pirellulales bacterium]